MKVCIAEKPSVAKEIAQILGAKSRKDGYFEGNGYQITWTFGHLCTLQEPHDYDPTLKRWDIYKLPIVPKKFNIKLIGNKGVQKQFNVIKQLVNNANEVINCGDAGQEGELIQRWVLQKAGCKKPVKRLWVSSLTEEALKKGFLNLKDASNYELLYHAGSSRAIGDWLLGINGTRLYTMKYGGKGVLLSIGRVQTPTLAMIVNRHLEIQNFVSKLFWELKTNYREVKFSAVKGKFYEQEKGNVALQKCINHPIKILSIEKKDGKEFAPKLFDLTSLQVECNKKLNLSADNTLKIAQTLYERKHITYPRVDTQYLPEDQYPQIENILKSLTNYKTLVTPLLGKTIKKSKNVFNNKKVTDHHAIIPTNVTAQGLSGRELQVYDIIVKRFIANFYPECLVSKTAVTGEANTVQFKANGKIITSVGWRIVYGQEATDEDKSAKENNKEDNQVLPNFIEGESGSHEPFLEEKETKPPKYYTEATLLRGMETAGKQIDDDKIREAMKENGIGRPSTRANIIETLFRRKYIIKQRKNIVPTEAGEQLISVIQSDLLKSPELTGSWEKRLRQIETGSYSVQQFFAELNQMLNELVNDVKKASSKQIVVPEKIKRATGTTKHKKPDTEAIPCPKCKNGTILKGKTAFGCNQHKKGCHFIVPFELFEKKLSEKQIFDLVKKSKTPLIKGFQKDGKKIEGTLLLNKSFNIELIEKEAQKLICPKCKKGVMLKGKKAYGCQNYSIGCRTLIPFEIHGKKLTEPQIKKLILAGKTGKIKGFSHPSIKEGVLILNRNFEIDLVN